MHSNCLAIVQFVKRNKFFWYFEVRVRYRRKTFTFAISSSDEFLLLNFKLHRTQKLTKHNAKDVLNNKK